MVVALLAVAVTATTLPPHPLSQPQGQTPDLPQCVGETSQLDFANVVGSMGGPLATRVATVDSDDLYDVVLFQRTSRNLVWLRNEGVTGLSSTVNVIGSLSSSAVTVSPRVLFFVGDLDGDGDNDVAAPLFTGVPAVGVFENTSPAGTAWTPHTFGTRTEVPVMVAAADIDGDGDFDLVLARTKPGTGIPAVFDTFINSGGNVFVEIVDVTSVLDTIHIEVAHNVSSAGPVLVAVGTAGDGSRGMFYFRPNTTAVGTFETTPVMMRATQTQISYMSLGDVDGDSDTDGLVSAFQNSNLFVLENVDGVGTMWTSHRLLGGNTRAYAAIFYDLNDDGFLDVVTVDGSGDALVRVFLSFGNAASPFVFTYAQSAQSGTFSTISVSPSSTASRELMVVATGQTSQAVNLYHVDPSPTWASRVTLPNTFETPDVTTVADVDVDGDLDVIAFDQDVGLVLLFDNTDGRGTFKAGAAIASSGGIGTFVGVCEDLDGDGDPDLVFYQAPDLSVVLNINAGQSWSARTTLPLPVAPVSRIAPAVADLDGDGIVDIAFASDEVVAIYLGFGGGTFDLLPLLDTPDIPQWEFLNAIDMDADGDADLVGSSYINGPDRVAYYVNYGNASFDPLPVVISSTFESRQGCAGDLTGDGLPDVVVGDFDQIGWIEQLPGATFSAYNQLFSSPSAGARFAGVIDVDFDGDLDIYASFFNIRSVLVFRNNGSGVFASEFVDSNFNAVSMLSAGDIDGDGDVDIVGSGTTLEWWSALTRGITHVYAPATVSLADVACPASNSPSLRTSAACVAAGLRRLSPCFRDTLLLPPGTYGCAVDAHLTVTHAARIAPLVPGSDVTFDCTPPPVGPPTSGFGRVLFRTIVHPDALVFTTGDLELVDVTLNGLGVATLASTGTPGLRAEGAGARIALINVTVVGAAAGARDGPLAIGEGTGGSVYASTGAVVEAWDSAWIAPTASLNGGAIAVRDTSSSLIMVRSRITGASVGGNGGGIHVAAGASATLIDTHVTGATAGLDGGGLAATESSTVVNVHGTSSVTGCVAGRSGGAIALASARINITDLVCSGNSASAHGGCVHAAGGAQLDVTSGTMVANVAGGAGGAVAIAGAAALFGSGVSVSESEAAFGGTFAAVASTYALPTAPGSGAVARTPALDPAPAVALSFGGTVGTSTAQLGQHVFVCNAGVNVAGASGLSDSLGVFACAESGSTPPAPPISAWVSAPVPIVASTPPVALAATADSFPSSIPSGVAMERGSLASTDAFGTTVIDGTLRVNVGLDGAAAGAGVAAAGYEFGVGMDSSGLFDLSSLRLSGPPSALGVGDVGVALAVDGTVAAEMPSTVVAMALTACPPGLGSVGELGDDKAVVCAACGEGTFSTETSTAPCTAFSECPRNAVRSEGSNGTCLCERGFWTPALVPDTACIACPTGGVCIGGTAAPIAAPGFAPESGGSASFVTCPSARACVGGGLCAEGHTARLCAECSDGWYKLRDECHKCKSSSVVLVIGIVLALACLAAVTAIYVFSLSDGLRYKFAAAMIGLNGLQIAAIYGQLELDWGPFAVAYFDVASALNLNLELASPECSLASDIDTWALKWGLTLLFPLFAAVLVGIIGACILLCAMGGLVEKTKAEVASAGGRAWFQIMVILYLPLTSAAFAPFGCRRDETKRWVMTADPARSCYTTAWWSGLFVPGLAAVALYAVAIPMAVVGMLRSRRSSMDEVSFVLRFGFLVGRFTNAAWWFEAAIMVRKLGVVVCMTAFATTDSRASAAALALIGALLHLSLSRPYRSAFHNALALVVLSATALVLVAGTFDDFTFRRTGIIAGIVVNVLAIVGGNALDLWLIAVGEAKAVHMLGAAAGFFATSDDTAGGSPDAMSMGGVELDVVDDFDFATSVVAQPIEIGLASGDVLSSGLGGSGGIASLEGESEIGTV